jgi:hypothetical protein
MKFLIYFLLFVLSIVPTMAQYGSYKKGVEAYQQGDYKTAITHLTDFLSKHTRQNNFDQDVYYIRALSNFKMNNYPEALTDFQQALVLDHPNKGNIHWFMAKSYSEQGFSPKAIEEYAEALKLLKQPNDEVTILLERSIQFKKISEQSNAIHDLETALALQPENSKVRNELASYEVSTASTINIQSDLTADLEKLKELYKDEKRYALVIGNSKYKKVPALKNPSNDAASISAALRKFNFEVIEVEDATYMEIRSAFFQFHEKLVNGPKGQTVGLFFYAGHGLQNEGENYLVPVDANLEYEDDIARQCFPVQKIILANMERSNSRMNIVIMDACRNNPFPSTSRATGEGLAEMKKARGSFIAYSTSPGSVASDGVGKNGLYTQELLKAIEKPGLSLEQVFKEVRLNVLRLSGDKQNTWDASNITGDFHFNFN